MHMCRNFLLKILLLTCYIIMALYFVSTINKWPLSKITLCVFCSKLAQGSASMYYICIEQQQGINTINIIYKAHHYVCGIALYVILLHCNNLLIIFICEFHFMVLPPIGCFWCRCLHLFHLATKLQTVLTTWKFSSDCCFTLCEQSACVICPWRVRRSVIRTLAFRGLSVTPSSFRCAIKGLAWFVRGVRFLVVRFMAKPSFLS